MAQPRRFTTRVCRNEKIAIRKDVRNMNVQPSPVRVNVVSSSPCDGSWRRFTHNIHDEGEVQGTQQV